MDDKTKAGFLALHARLIIDELRTRLDIASNDPPVQVVDALFLLRIASILALEKDGSETTEAVDNCGLAYDVATRLADLFGATEPRVLRACDFLLARLGNFPGRQLLRSRSNDRDVPAKLVAPVLTLEALSRENENTVEFPKIGPRLLTDFQFRLVESLHRSRAVSVSAPTSAGKSFVLEHDILESIATTPGSALVYVVPTRALIHQVTVDLLSLFREAGLKEVIVSSAPIDFSDDQAKGVGIVYVLTQERLVTLLNTPDLKLKISKVYVDEAQEIADEDRGLILDSAIRDLAFKFPNARMCFASPLTKNPGYLFGEFDLAKSGEFFTERHSPVAQVVVRLEPVKGVTKAAAVTVVTPQGEKAVGQMELTFKFAGVLDRLANTARMIRKEGESVIVFANRPSDAMAIAEKLAEDTEGETADKDVLDLVEYVKTHVHSRFALADVLLKSVAFHYGKMPHIIRSQVEELLKAKKLRFVVCTSTLLQGVNLPARHIVVLAPRQGNGKPMTSPDFWNLAGRAGRLRESFRGFVWCIAPNGWETKPFGGERLSEIKSAFQSSLEDSHVRDAAVAVLNGTAPLSMVEQRHRVEQFLGKAFSEFTLQKQKLQTSTRVPLLLQPEMIPLDTRLESLAANLRVPPLVCTRNTVISPTLLNDLWDRFSKGFTQEMMPIDPVRPNAIEHFRAIFQIIDEVFIGSGNNSWRYFATLAYFWVMGRSLKELIEDRIKFKFTADAPDKKQVNREIRGLLEDLEQTLRFTYVKYLKAYTDVLRAFLLAGGKPEEADSITPWDLFLEFGARDKVLLMLMSIGVSRSTAILIRKAITTQNDISRDECWARLQNLSLTVLSIPAVCKAEIRQLTGNSN